jgi:16S rRNA processing protein RimM
LGEGFPDNLLLVGKVIGPHGLGGLLRIWSYAESERTFLNSGKVFLGLASGEPHEYRVLSVVPHKNAFLMRLEGLSTLNAAESYRNAAILIEKTGLEREGEGEYFWHELIGLEVYVTTGEFIGTVKRIFATGSNDIYVVQKGKKEILIPAIHDVVQEVDLAGKRMIISEMEGLLDLNET